MRQVLQRRLPYSRWCALTGASESAIAETRMLARAFDELLAAVYALRA